MPAVVACLHHLEQPCLGLASAPFERAGVAVREHDVRPGAPLPDLDDVDGIVAFGGEQSVTDIDRRAELGDEARLLAQAVERGMPVLGVCLGGQLLAHALGASVRRMPRLMLGWFEVERLAAAAEDPVFAALPPRLRTLHWNEDSFELPPGAVELLARAGPGVEAFRAGPAAWGVQFHPEADAAILERWYGDTPEQVAEAGTTVERARAAHARHLPAQAELAAGLFGAFARVVTSADRRSGEPARLP